MGERIIIGILSWGGLAVFVLCVLFLLGGLDHGRCSNLLTPSGGC